MNYEFWNGTVTWSNKSQAQNLKKKKDIKSIFKSIRSVKKYDPSENFFFQICSDFFFTLKISMLEQ